MNDYLGTSHEAIYDMVQAGEPGRSQTWAAGVSGCSRELGSQILSLREQCALISSVWSDGVGSVRLTADLGVVIDYLQVLADGLSGQSASYADITVQAAADLAAAQPPSALPPPPARSQAELSAEYRQIAASPVDPDVKDFQTAQVASQIATNQAAWMKAGETATTLDNAYRTALARLTQPPDPPPIVQDAATAGGAVDSPGATGSAAAVRVSSGGSALPAARPAPLGGWSVDRYLAGGPSAGRRSAGQTVLPGGAPSPSVPVETIGSVGSIDSGGVGADRAGVTGSEPAGWSGDGVTSAGTLSGGAAGLGYPRPQVDPVSLHRGIWDGSVNTGAAGLGSGGAAADHLAHGSFAGPGAGAVATGFDPVTGRAITAGPGRFDSAGVGADGAGWETAIGVGGIGALAAGAAMLTRGGAGAVTAAGLSGGFATGGSGAGGVGGSGISGSGVGGSGAGSYGTAATGGANAAGSARGIAPGMSGVGSNPLVQGGQIGQTGRGMSGATGAGIPRPGAPGSGIGGEHGYRVTWLVEDRDLYGRAPSVKSVIEASPEVE